MVDYHIGDLSEKYETGMRGPGYISNGSAWGDPGGDSYGSYQLESKLGTIQAYLKTGDAYTRQLVGLAVNSKEFKAKWRAIAEEDPEGFQQSQFNYLYYKPNGGADAIKYARVLGLYVDNFALHSAVFSTSNQSGKWKTGIFDRIVLKMGFSVENQINALYDARAAYFRRIKLSAEIRFNIIKERTVNERRDCLELARSHV